MWCLSLLHKPLGYLIKKLDSYNVWQYTHHSQYYELLLINKNANIQLFIILINESIYKQPICKKLDAISKRLPAVVLPVSNCGHS